ncbi:hypothetical protein JNW88_18640, partial [Micromonospora sp. ATA32]|nr:hypothetical protein [Micromonospora sp. ATA32]
MTLATNNLISLVGLHRRLRGALLRHLAAGQSSPAPSNPPTPPTSPAAP